MSKAPLSDHARAKRKKAFNANDDAITMFLLTEGVLTFFAIGSSVLISGDGHPIKLILLPILVGLVIIGLIWRFWGRRIIQKFQFEMIGIREENQLDYELSLALEKGLIAISELRLQMSKKDLQVADGTHTSAMMARLTDNDRVSLQTLQEIVGIPLVTQPEISSENQDLITGLKDLNEKLELAPSSENSESRFATGDQNEFFLFRAPEESSTAASQEK